MVRWLRGHLRMTDTIENEHFFVRKNGLLYATPLLLVLIMVEFSDVIFAVDSIPAIFAVTTDPFIVLTSNLFAILGLRAMYFLLSGVAERFSMLKYGLAVILVFIGIKMLIVDFYHIPIAISLGVVFGILTITLVINARLTISAIRNYERNNLYRGKPAPSKTPGSAHLPGVLFNMSQYC